MDGSSQTSCHYAETPITSKSSSAGYNSFYDFRKLFVQGLWSNPLDMVDRSIYEESSTISDQIIVDHTEVIYSCDQLQSIEETDEIQITPGRSVEADKQDETEIVYPTTTVSEEMSELSKDIQVDNEDIYESLQMPIESLLDNIVNLSEKSPTSSNSSGIEAGSSTVSNCSAKFKLSLLREDLNFSHYYPKDKNNFNRCSLTDKYCSAFTIASDFAKIAKKSRSKPHRLQGTNEHKPTKVVVAIDFGTAQCGFALSLHTDRNEPKIKVGFKGHKIPTVLLLNADGTFNSFGPNALQLLSSIEPSECSNFHCFKGFKNKMVSTDNSANPSIRSTAGVWWPAKSVFAHSLAYLKQEAMLEMQDSFGCLDETVITWVVTVPALWKQNAKQLIREAAYEAGVVKPTNSSKLIMSIEPEAAALNCLSVDKKHYENEAYMVVDCGGGTTDITAYQVVNDYGKSWRLSEIVGAAGVPCGSVSVDRAFEELLRSIFGPDFIQDFKQRNPSAYLALISSFEARKCQSTLYGSQPTSIILPFAFIKAYQQRKCHTVECAIHLVENADISWSSQGMLRLSASVMRKLFAKSLAAICEAISNVLSTIDSTVVTKLYLVGGYSESQILKQTIKSRFDKRLKVITTSDPSLAVLSGGVLFGLNPECIAIRRSRQTYGISVSQKFILGIHPIANQTVKNGQLWCADVFDQMVTIGQPLSKGHTVVRTFRLDKTDKNDLTVILYATDLINPQLVTDKGVAKCATVKFYLGPRKNYSDQREIEAELMFGETEVSIMAKELIDGATIPVQCLIDFLHI